MTITTFMADERQREGIKTILKLRYTVALQTFRSIIQGASWAAAAKGNQQ